LFVLQASSKAAPKTHTAGIQAGAQKLIVIEKDPRMIKMLKVWLWN
jgi:hypothetical protein